MTEIKGKQVSIMLEPTLYVLLTKVTQEVDAGTSQYVRQLIIDDLDKRGLLTQEILKRLL